MSAKTTIRGASANTSTKPGIGVQFSEHVILSGSARISHERSEVRVPSISYCPADGLAASTRRQILRYAQDDISK
jgi:hypothetical protein